MHMHMHIHIHILNNRDGEIDAMKINQQEVEQCQVFDWGLDDFSLDNSPLLIV